MKTLKTVIMTNKSKDFVLSRECFCADAKDVQNYVDFWHLQLVDCEESVTILDDSVTYLSELPNGAEFYKVTIIEQTATERKKLYTFSSARMTKLLTTGKDKLLCRTVSEGIKMTLSPFTKVCLADPL